jgi:hypothetical protein
MREMLNAYTILVWKHEWKINTARPRRRWEDSIKIYVTEIQCESVY